jgi:hypothetical protein
MIENNEKSNSWLLSSLRILRRDTTKKGVSGLKTNFSESYAKKGRLEKVGIKARITQTSNGEYAVISRANGFGDCSQSITMDVASSYSQALITGRAMVNSLAYKKGVRPCKAGKSRCGASFYQ